MNIIRKMMQRITAAMKGVEFLCDICKYDYDGACKQSQRPNATNCDDFEKR